MRLPSAELEKLKGKIDQALRPEDLFGDLGTSPEQQFATLSQAFKEYAKRCHPDQYRVGGASLADTASAEAAFKHLNNLQSTAKKLIEEGKYGKRETIAEEKEPLIVMRNGQRDYRLMDVLAAGTVADVYAGEYDDESGAVRKVTIKIARDPADNDLMRNEQGILRDLDHVSLPKLIDTFVTPEGRAGSVFGFIEGMDLYELRELPQHREGLVPLHHLGWILERQLSLLGYLHKNMVVHGNIDPGHLIVTGGVHNVSLVGFCFAVRNPAAGDFIKVMTEDYSAPEVERQWRPHPKSDLYSLGKAMAFLAGGDPGTGRLPSTVHSEIQDFLQRLIEYDPEKRATHAWEEWATWKEIRSRRLRQPTFIPLELNA